MFSSKIDKFCRSITLTFNRNKMCVILKQPQSTCLAKNNNYTELFREDFGSVTRHINQSINQLLAKYDNKASVINSGGRTKRNLLCNSRWHVHACATLLTHCTLFIFDN